MGRHRGSSGNRSGSGGGSGSVGTWTQQRAVTVTNASGSYESGYQALVSLTSGNFDFAAAKSDGSDIRITDTNQLTVLPYWIESYDPTGQTAKIWVKTDMPSSGAKTLYIYSANPLASSKSDGQNTFLFWDDFSGVVGWNRYATPNPFVSTAPSTWKSSIVGDALVIKPDAGDSNWGFFFFGSAGGTSGDIGYASSPTGLPGTWTEYGSNPVLTHGGTNDGYLAVKPSVFYDGGVYHMAYAGKSAATNWQILYATATSRTGPWTKQGVILSPNGSSAEGSRLDCPCWLRDASGVVRLYYSGNEATPNEPQFFCLATSSSFAGPFTRHPSNPIASPNPAIYWQATALGGMSVRQLSNGSFDIAYNAFEAGDTSRMGRTNSADGVTLNLKVSDLLFDLAPQANAWDRFRLYRPCIYDIGDGIDRLLYNALGDTEKIGYAEYTRTIDITKWNVLLQNLNTMTFSGGNMQIDDLSTSGSTYDTGLTTKQYQPGVDVILETRIRRTATRNASNSDITTLALTTDATAAFPLDAPNLQFLFIRYPVSAGSRGFVHQSRSSSSFGGEDDVYVVDPPINTWYINQLVKRSSAMDYRVLSDGRAAVLGTLAGNTDAPQSLNTWYPLLGLRMAGGTWDWFIARRYLATEPTVAVGTVSTVSKAGL